MMLSAWWWLPLGLATVATVALWRGVRVLQAEAVALGESIRGLAALRPLVAEIRGENASVVAPGRRTGVFGPR